jgi:sugar phosphate isomerase/epimerase
VLTEAEWAVFLPRLTRFAELLAAEGLRIAYHHHMGTVVQTGAEIDRVMAGTGPAFTLLLDTGHATWGGADPADLARRYRDRIVHVHVKDVRPDVARKAKDGDWSFLTSVLAGVYTVPGDGSVDYVSVFRELPDYSGWVVIEAEQDPVKAHPATYVKMGYENLVRFLREADLKHGRT